MGFPETGGIFGEAASSLSFLLMIMHLLISRITPSTVEELDRQNFIVRAYTTRTTIPSRSWLPAIQNFRDFKCRTHTGTHEL